jgi:nicotinate (nicotinamide) nucleotide adenylyltransferase
MTALRYKLTLPRSSLVARFSTRCSLSTSLPYIAALSPAGGYLGTPRIRTRTTPSHTATMSTSNRDILLDAGLNDHHSMSLSDYTFPKNRLRASLTDPTKVPLVLVSCGSFSPPTNLHLRMFEEAADYCRFETSYEVLGGFFSPVGDAYKKAGLASAQHRINMTRIAVEDSSEWIGVDPWEPLHKEYLPTVKVLDHFDHELNEVMGGIAGADGQKKRIHVALLAGADLIQTMSTPGLWAQEDLNRILGHYGAFILERSGTDIGAFFLHRSLTSTNIFQMTRLSASSSSAKRSA